ncbi:hypothetical protein E4T66_17330 [Sinimarinibacterium sp. CAU 1509]|uniref:hypothetical protein n=1 Tax=Sinimarinibacterium sp. CAU 1509 TaxID=2562283 RepID=UPI0010AB61C9|nr:hypothetical protein [Sinimarinibacterium sp. CAU 1509]TJY57173.1 hypothetical protein E4T66_17330 [Sinimarinibacterium sp. CAU 1509]
MPRKPDVALSSGRTLSLIDLDRGRAWVQPTNGDAALSAAEVDQFTRIAAKRMGHALRHRKHHMKRARRR